MKAFLCVRSSGMGLHHVLLLAEHGKLDLKVDGDIVTVVKLLGAGAEEAVAAVKMSEQYFVTIGEEPPKIAQG